MTAKLCGTMRVRIDAQPSNPNNIEYTEVTLPDKFIGCDYIETVSCCSTSGNQYGTIVFANSYCYTDCTSNMLLLRSSTSTTVHETEMKLSADGSIFMYNRNYGVGFSEYIMVLGYKFQ